MNVTLQKSAAARGVREDRLGSGPLEGRDVAFREPDRLRVVAGVRVQRAAAALVGHFDDPRRQTRQHPRGRRVNVAVGHAHDAAQEQGHRRAGRFHRDRLVRGSP